MKKLYIYLLALAMMFSPISTALACSVCFKDPHAQSTIALQQAVFFLLGIVLIIFTAIFKFIWSFNKRSRMHSGV